MLASDDQVKYWNSVGVTKPFGHPVEFEWLNGLDRSARVLDYGCGYGRVTGMLREHGFAEAEGVDSAPGMISEARRNWPGIRFTTLADPPALPYPDGGIDAVTLFTVLTCIPSDAGQRGLVAELTRVLRRGGLLYFSDLCLQDDERNRARYDHFAAEYGTYGIFETGDGAVCRHNSRASIDELLAGFDIEATREIAVTTMNGHPSQATQILARKA